MLKIYPYRLHNTWVFDDPRTGLKEEAFVCGMTEIISHAVLSYTDMNLHEANRGIELSFSDKPFLDFQVALHWFGRGQPIGIPGDWYAGLVGGAPYHGWLCPALTLYFKQAPKTLYCSVGKLPVGVDPIWEPQCTTTRRFVSGE